MINFIKYMRNERLFSLFLLISSSIREMEQTRELQAFRGRNKLIQQLVNRVNVKKLRTLELIKQY